MDTTTTTTDAGAVPQHGGERHTRQRDAIKHVLQSARRPLSTQEILDAAGAQVQGVGIATVYRNLKAFVQAGEVSQVTMPGERPRYEIAGHGHHHHFHCTHCDRVFDVLQCPGDLRHLAPEGFSVERHDITLYGRCAECSDFSRPPAARSA